MRDNSFFPSSIPKDTKKLTLTLLSAIRNSIDDNIPLTRQNIDEIIHNILLVADQDLAVLQLAIELLASQGDEITDDQWRRLLAYCHEVLQGHSNCHPDLIISSLKLLQCCPRNEMSLFLQTPGIEVVWKQCLKHDNAVVRCAAIKHLGPMLFHVFIAMSSIAKCEMQLDTLQERILCSEDVRDVIGDIWRALGNLCCDPCTQVAGQAFEMVHMLLSQCQRLCNARVSPVSSFGHMAQLDPLMNSKDGGIWNKLILRVIKPLIPKLVRVVSRGMWLLPAEPTEETDFLTQNGLRPVSTILDPQTSGVSQVDSPSRTSSIGSSEKVTIQKSAAQNSKSHSLRDQYGKGYISNSLAQQYAQSVFGVISYLLVYATNSRSSSDPFKEFNLHPLRPQTIAVQAVAGHPSYGMINVASLEFARDVIRDSLVKGIALELYDPIVALSATEYLIYILVTLPQLCSENRDWLGMLTVTCEHLWKVTFHNSDDSTMQGIRLGKQHNRVLLAMAQLASIHILPGGIRVQLWDMVIESSATILSNCKQQQDRVVASRLMAAAWQSIYLYGRQNKNEAVASPVPEEARENEDFVAVILCKFGGQSTSRGNDWIGTGNEQIVYTPNGLARSLIVASLLSTVLENNPTTQNLQTHVNDAVRLWTSNALSVVETLSDCLSWPTLDVPNSTLLPISEAPHVASYVNLLGSLCESVQTQLAVGEPSISEALSNVSSRLDVLLVDLVEWKAGALHAPLVARTRLIWTLSQFLGVFGTVDRNAEALCLTEVIRDSLLSQSSHKTSGRNALEYTRTAALILMECLKVLCIKFPSLVVFVQQLLAQVAKQPWLSAATKGHGRMLYARVTAMKTSAMLEHMRESYVCHSAPFRMSHVWDRQDYVSSLFVDGIHSSSKWAAEAFHSCNTNAGSFHDIVANVFENSEDLARFVSRSCALSHSFSQLMHWDQCSPLRELGRGEDIGGVPRDSSRLSDLFEDGDNPRQKLRNTRHTQITLSGCDDPIKVTAKVVLNSETASLSMLLRVQNVSGLHIDNVCFEVGTTGPLSLDNRCDQFTSNQTANSELEEGGARSSGLKHGSYVERGFLFRIHSASTIQQKGDGSCERFVEQKESLEFNHTDDVDSLCLLGFGSEIDLQPRGIQVSILLRSHGSGLRVNAMQTENDSQGKKFADGIVDDLRFHFQPWRVPHDWLLRPISASSNNLTLDSVLALKTMCESKHRVVVEVTHQREEDLLRGLESSCGSFTDLRVQSRSAGNLRIAFASESLSGTLLLGEVVLYPSQRCAEGNSDPMNCRIPMGGSQAKNVRDSTCKERLNCWRGQIYLYSSNESCVASGLTSNCDRLVDWINLLFGISQIPTGDLRLLWHGTEPGARLRPCKHVSDKEWTQLTSVSQGLTQDDVVDTKEARNSILPAVLSQWTRIQRLRSGTR